MKKVLLANKWVGDGYPCFVVGEIGGLFKNFEEAKRLIDSAIEIGLDAVKFQTLEAETITTKNNLFDMEVTGHVSQYDFFKSFEISKTLQKQVVRYANDKGISIFSAPSHMKDLELMKEMDLPVFKIGSDLACHIPLLKETAKLGKPMILSTGMCSMDEVKESVNAILSTGNEQLILLHCVSDYPAKIEESNLNAIQSMKKEFDLPVGYSDHTVGIFTPFAAAVMGANVVEKHFKDVRNSSSPDDIHALSMEEFGSLIKSIRSMEMAKGSGIKVPSKSELKNMKSNRVSIIAMVSIKEGSVITKEMIDVRRPGTGLSPLYFEKVLGKKAKRNILKEEPLTWDMFE